MNFIQNKTDYGVLGSQVSERETDEQCELLIELDEKFSPLEDDTDRCILYEITKFKLMEGAPANFWDQYIDFFDLGDKLNIRKELIDERALDRKW